MTAPERLCKQPSETRKLIMDFTASLASSETISGIVSINHEMVGGSTSDLSITASGLESTKKVNMWISGGTNRQSYKIEVLVTTSAAQIIEGDGILFVSDNI